MRPCLILFRTRSPSPCLGWRACSVVPSLLALMRASILPQTPQRFPATRPGIPLAALLIAKPDPDVVLPDVLTVLDGPVRILITGCCAAGADDVGVTMSLQSSNPYSTRSFTSMSRGASCLILSQAACAAGCTPDRNGFPATPGNGPWHCASSHLFPCPAARLLHAFHSHPRPGLGLQCAEYSCAALVGDTDDERQPHLFAGADFAGCTWTLRSMSWMHLCVRGPRASCPILGPFM